MELNFGKNLTSVTRKENTENIVTRLYVEGEYGDYGYVGIDDVNPTGLPFLFNFEYYKQIGAFQQEHQDALDRYLTDMTVVRAEGMLHAADALALETELIKLWGQIDYVVYVLTSGNVTRRITGGGVAAEQVTLQAGDELVVLKPGGKHERRTVTVDDPTFLPDDCFAVKFLYKATGVIGGKEVAVEAKEILLEKYRAQWATDMTEAKREQLRKQIGDTEAAIQELYEGNAESEGLYA